MGGSRLDGAPGAPVCPSPTHLVSRRPARNLDSTGSRGGDRATGRRYHDGRGELIQNSNSRHERAYLMSLDYEDQGLAAVEEQMLELGELAKTAGVVVVGTDTQRRPKPDPALFIGKGKVEALHALKHEADFNL